MDRLKIIYSRLGQAFLIFGVVTAVYFVLGAGHRTAFNISRIN